MRVFLVVLDSFGEGALPDAALYGDAGADTFGHIRAACPSLALPTLRAMGLYNLPGVGGGVARPLASYGRLAELSPGKDTTTGHWELAGLRLTQPFPTFPNGFPPAFLRTFERESGFGTLGNRAASGTQIIEALGEEHLRTGKLIVYTSADSVFQIAAHEDIVPPDKLYEVCRVARRLLTGELAVGRVIARPFTGKPGYFTRTTRRHDFSLEPSGETLLDRLRAAGKTVWGIGKIADIFAGRGLTRSTPTGTNALGLEALRQAVQTPFDGLCFVNLVDFDSLYGHRRDPAGYASALEAFDRALPPLLAALHTDDLLLLTADHGCDPCHSGTDHTREYVPLLAYQKDRPGLPLGTMRGLDQAGDLAERFLLPASLLIEQTYIGEDTNP